MAQGHLAETLVIGQAHFFLPSMDRVDPPLPVTFSSPLWLIISETTSKWAEPQDRNILVLDFKELKFFIIYLLAWAKLPSSWNPMSQALTCPHEQIPFKHPPDLCLDFRFSHKVPYKSQLLYFYFPLQILLICLFNRYAEIFLKEKTLKNEVNNFYIIMH